MYQPAVPALVYMPLVKIWGRNTPDFLITAVMGSLNTVMVFFILVLLARRLNLKIAAYWYPLLSLFWAFGTVHFYLSMLGAVWFVAQVMGQFFILLCVLLLLINGKTLFTALAGVAFALASYSKNDLMFYIFFYSGFILAFLFKRRWQKAGNNDCRYISAAVCHFHRRVFVA